MVATGLLIIFFQFLASQQAKHHTLPSSKESYSCSKLRVDFFFFNMLQQLPAYQENTVNSHILCFHEGHCKLKEGFCQLEKVTSQFAATQCHRF